MAQSPVSTVIKNCKPADRVIRWTGEGSVWVAANDSIEVPYEVWSKADRKQKEGIIADCQDKSIELTVKILTTEGTYLSIKFDPSVIMGQKPVVIKEDAEPVSVIGEIVKDEQMHTVKAVSDEGAQAAAHFGAVKEAEQPAITPAVVESAGTEGFQVVPSTEVISIKESVEDSAEVANQEKLVEEAEVSDAAVDTISDESLKAFNKAVEAKDWQKALHILIDVYGKEKITFSARTIMTMKDFNLIAEKYNLR